MQLVDRDKGCVVCHAMETDSIYQYGDDFHFFEGSHIFLLPCSHWCVRFEIFMVDTGSHYRYKVGHAWIPKPYHGPVYHAKQREATRNKRDRLRINSLENGMLLCLFHDKAYDALRFSTHHTVFPWYFSGIFSI
jgi:hypothetical protein